MIDSAQEFQNYKLLKQGNFDQLSASDSVILLDSIISQQHVKDAAIAAQ